MKVQRLDLLKRLSHIRDEEAGRNVSQQQQRLTQARDQATMLEDYRRSLSAGHFAGQQASPALLRSHAAFSGVAGQATEQAQQAVVETQDAVNQAVEDWQSARENSRVLDQKYASTRQRLRRQAERKEDEASQEAAKKNGPR